MGETFGLLSFGQGEKEFVGCVLITLAETRKGSWLDFSSWPFDRMGRVGTEIPFVGGVGFFFFFFYCYFLGFRLKGGMVSWLLIRPNGKKEEIVLLFV
jgi:hypothetical protein